MLDFFTTACTLLGVLFLKGKKTITAITCVTVIPISTETVLGQVHTV